eukprot:116105-Hanusia_phi.AAC.4
MLVRRGRGVTSETASMNRSVQLDHLSNMTFPRSKMEDFAMLVHKLTEPAKQGDPATVSIPLDRNSADEVPRCIDTCLPSGGGEQHLKGWVVTSVNEWGGDQERIFLLTDKRCYRIKFDFDAKQVSASKAIELVRRCCDMWERLDVLMSERGPPSRVWILQSSKSVTHYLGDSSSRSISVTPTSSFLCSHSDSLSLYLLFPSLVVLSQDLPRGCQVWKKEIEQQQVTTPLLSRSSQTSGVSRFHARVGWQQEHQRDSSRAVACPAGH